MIEFDPTDIQHWADRREAHHELPALIRDLVSSTLQGPAFTSAFSLRQFSRATGMGRAGHGSVWEPVGTEWQIGLGVELPQ